MIQIQITTYTELTVAVVALSALGAVLGFVVAEVAKWLTRRGR